MARNSRTKLLKKNGHDRRNLKGTKGGKTRCLFKNKRTKQTFKKGLAWFKNLSPQEQERYKLLK